MRAIEIKVGFDFVARDFLKLDDRIKIHSILGDPRNQFSRELALILVSDLFPEVPEGNFPPAGNVIFIRNLSDKKEYAKEVVIYGDKEIKIQIISQDKLDEIERSVRW